MTPSILIIGSPSIDLIDVNNISQQVAGGAGLYTALGAIQSGAEVTLFAPKPIEIPLKLAFVEKKMKWIGPSISQEQLPHFHIIQSDSNTIYKEAYFGSEADLDPIILPDDLSEFDIVHIVPLGSTKQQMKFVIACRERGAKRISAGTAKPMAENEPYEVIKIKSAVDFFFMNNYESDLINKYEKDNKILNAKITFITAGKNGVIINQGTHVATINSPRVHQVDPTGAGDTFCGATLTKIASGHHPVMAARHGVFLASNMVTGIGPEKLLIDISTINFDTKRVSINHKRLKKIADLISKTPEVFSFPFIDDITLPPKNHPITLDYFFVTTLQQFSFWSHKNERYFKPLIETVSGEQLKGAFYLFKAYLKKIDIDPDFFSPQRQANVTIEEMENLFKSDNGFNVMPALQLHVDMAQAYGKTMLELGWTPKSIIDDVKQSELPLKRFFELIDRIGGYREDPLRKKSALLALILEQRPEKFIRFADIEMLPPVVDYHCMRASLRLGLVDIQDKILKQKLHSRQLVSVQDEWDVRYEIYKAVNMLPNLSGQSMGAVDWFFFMSRKRCPEMTDPVCSSCVADMVCAKRKDFFQPVIRTSHY